MWKVTRRSSPITVLHLVHSVEHGGTERQLCRIVRRLATDGDTRHIVCTQRDAGPRSIELAGAADVVSLGAGGRDRLAFARLARLIKAESVDLVHARNVGTWADAVLGCAIARRAEPVLAFHGLQSGDAFTPKQRLRLRALRVGSRRMTAVSISAREQLVTQIGCQPRNVTVLPNGVDVDRFSPQDDAVRAQSREELGLGEGDFAIGVVANFVSPVKGHAVLLEAVSRLAPACPTLKVVFAGIGPMEDDLRRASELLGLDRRVVFAGAREDIPELMAAFDVCVCPSLSEGMSNALLEAMSCSLPCIVTDVGDHRRLFAEVDPAAVVPPRDADALARAIASLMLDADRRRSSGCRARKLVASEYDYERTVEAYRKFYRDAVRKPVAVCERHQAEVVGLAEPKEQAVWL